MARCSICGKKRVISTRGTHKRGVAGGQWKKKAPKTRKIFKPNLQRFQGKMYCTKCLRKLKREASSSSATALRHSEASQRREATEDKKVSKVSSESPAPKLGK